MTGFNSKREAAANKLQKPAQPVADWDSPQVRIVYEILIDGETPPNTDEHWEGFVARKIVAALAQPAQEPVACVGPWDGPTLTLLPRSIHQTFEHNQPLYAAPPQRPWVGLTGEDCKGMSAGDKMVAMWANRILRERNS